MVEGEDRTILIYVTYLNVSYVIENYNNLVDFENGSLEEEILYGVLYKIYYLIDLPIQLIIQLYLMMKLDFNYITILTL